MPDHRLGTPTQADVDEEAIETQEVGEGGSRHGVALDVLVLEDSPTDADLILHELRRGGYEPSARRVANCGEMLEALSEGAPEIVLLDYTLEGGETALQALTALAELGLDLPAILISGVIGEEEAADALRAGARDFVNKGNLTRLVPAVARELAQVEARRQIRAGVEALRQSEQRLRLALDAGGLGSWEWNLDTALIHWSATLEQMFGLESGTFGGTYAAFIQLVHPDDRELVGASVEQALARDSPAIVYRALWPDGTVRWHERKSQRVTDADGRFDVMAGVTFDVTEREEAARALGESEERFRLIAEHARDLIALLDVDGRPTYLSPSWESSLGYPPGALLETYAGELIHPDDWPEGSVFGTGVLRELRLRKADGSWLAVEGLSYQVTGRAGSQFAVIARDISERKRAEERRERLEDELRQVQKMEAIGQFAGGIAHDFNNLLTVISGYAEILLRRLGREAESGPEIAEIGRAAERAAHLTRQLLAFSRKQVLEPRLLLLNDVVAETQTMLGRMIGDDIGLRVDLAADAWPICADVGQMEQIIMNLVGNARDAMPEGGTVVLRTENVTLEETSPDGMIVEGAPSDWVALTVTDTGHGMDPTTLSRIFEPFFTTKPRGAGTGLGLATVHGIVKQSEGRIEVTSEPGAGTSVRCSFPRMAGEVRPFTSKPAPDLPLMGSETVLLVEDEEALRAVGRIMLETYGYAVLTAGDGVAACELADEHAGPIDVLMTDIQMPNMGGIELAERLSALRPDLKVIYTSGYADSEVARAQIAGEPYLQKPYGMERMAQTLRKLLDQPQTPVARPEGEWS